MEYTKEEFIQAIESLRDQYDFDTQWSLRAGEIFGMVGPTYNNSRLVNAVFKQLHKQFPPEEGICAIQFFCYSQNFGRDTEPETTIEQLWQQLKEI